MQINSKFILIDNKKAMELAVVNFTNSRVISIDTESSGYYTYFSKVCLIQITVNNKNYIIDPLSSVDLKLLDPIFKNPQILKIFHSAPDDIKALKRDFGYTFVNIADTMYSSKLLGLEHNSLNYLVEYYHNMKLSKTEQKSNWEKRPLDKQQLIYAALDTAYLESIWEKMSSELEKAGLLEEALSEFEKFTEEVYRGRENSQELNWHKFPNILKFTPEERRTIYDILHYREEKARRVNKAPFRIINNESISKIVSEKMDEEKLIQIFGKKVGLELSKIVKNPTGPPLEKVDFPKLDENITPHEMGRLRHLQKWRDKIMKKRGVDHSMLLSNKQLLQLIRKPPKDIEELRKENMMSNWKVDHYGNSLLKALANENYEDLLSSLRPIVAKKKIENSNSKTH
jgi:ribonuclease D